MVLPLAFIIFVSAVRDLMEDIERHRADRLQNNAPVNKLRLPSTQSSSSAQSLGFTVGMCEGLRVGELVRVSQNEEIPADLAIIASSSSNSGQCFVMTANLDGESSLKPRYVPSALRNETYFGCFTEDGQQARPAALTKLPGVQVRCEAPNGRIDKFRGELLFHEDERSATLDITNVLFRGTHLKDTAWVIGLVIYTGSDTRVRQNASDTPIKRSWLYNFINRVTLYIVLVQIVILVIAVIVQKHLVSSKSVLNNPFIPDDVKYAEVIDYIWLFLAYMLLFSNFVPISLQVTIDFTRYFQARVIALDSDGLSYSPTRLVSVSSVLVDASGGNSKRTTVRVQSSELNEELGLVEHVFSDKTGTLTCNKMQFYSCHVDGRTYECELDGSLRAIESIHIPPLAVLGGKPAKDSIASNRCTTPVAKLAQVQKFLLNLAVNNSIFPSVISGPTGLEKTEYAGPSPDERALVLAAGRAGVSLHYRDSSRVVVNIQGEDVSMEVIHVFDFSSDRKRSSILVRNPSGRLLLLVKGADSVILNTLSSSTNSPSRLMTAREQMKVYSSNGLRVLCIAEREIGFDEYRSWLTRYNDLDSKIKNAEGESNVDALEHKKDALIAELEGDLTLVGVSAIEDKIQEGAPETLQKLREAGVKVWMLTGDRPDTATNVAHSVRLITTEMRLIRLSDAKEFGESRESAERLLSQEKREAEHIHHPQDTKRVHTPLALLIDDRVIDTIFSFNLEKELLDLCLLCESVLCARVSPKQKELIVQMVRKLRPHQVTMAVGDGANDVPMIQRAHIGVGIAGEEGHQAADAGDYSLPNFQHLQRLVLVHGRAMNRRIAILTLYIFYKNVLLVLPQFVYGAYCLYSGQSTYYDTLLQLFNICFTALPVLYFAIVDEDISSATTLANPRLYSDGYRHEFLNLRLFATWMAEAVVASILIIMLPAGLLPLAPWSGLGKDNDLWAMGTTQNFIVVVLANVRLMLEVSSDTKRMLTLVILSVLFWWLVAFVFSSSILFGREFYGILRVGALTNLILLAVFCSICALGMAFCARVWRIFFCPLPRTISREIDFLSGRTSSRSVDAIYPIDRDEGGHYQGRSVK